MATDLFKAALERVRLRNITDDESATLTEGGMTEDQRKTLVSLMLVDAVREVVSELKDARNSIR